MVRSRMPRRQEPLLSVATVLWLQTTCGNRAVQRLLARKARERAQQLAAAIPVEGRGWWRRIISWVSKVKAQQ